MGPGKRRRLVINKPKRRKLKPMVLVAGNRSEDVRVARQPVTFWVPNEDACAAGSRSIEPTAALKREDNVLARVIVPASLPIHLHGNGGTTYNQSAD